MSHIPTEQRKDELAQAAVEVIARYGVRGATTRRIADAAKASLATLHYCFGTKEELFLDVFTRVGAALVPPAGGTTDSDGARGGVTPGFFLKTSLDWMLENGDYALAQVDLYLWVLRTAPDRASSPYEELAGAICEQLSFANPGLSRGRMEDSVWLAISALDGLVMQWFHQRDADAVRRLARIQAELLDDIVHFRHESGTEQL